MLNVDGFIDSLRYLVLGMGGIFAVILVIYLFILLFNRIFPCE